LTLLFNFLVPQHTQQATDTGEVEVSAELSPILEEETAEEMKTEEEEEEVSYIANHPTKPSSLLYGLVGLFNKRKDNETALVDSTMDAQLLLEHQLQRSVAADNFEADAEAHEHAYPGSSYSEDCAVIDQIQSGLDKDVANFVGYGFYSKPSHSRSRSRDWSDSSSNASTVFNESDEDDVADEMDTQEFYTEGVPAKGGKKIKVVKKRGMTSLQAAAAKYAAASAADQHQAENESIILV